jgi:hypothetical protein
MSERQLERQIERQQWMFRVSTAVVTALFAAVILRYGDESDWWALILPLLVYGYFEYKHQQQRRWWQPPKG